MDERRDPSEKAEWDANPLVDYPIGPDDAGNAVMHGVGFIVSGWRWLTRKLTDRE